MSPLAIFRADANAAIGGGHVMRCLTLADKLATKGWRCIFAGSSAGAEEAGYVVCGLDGDPVEQAALLRRLFPQGCELLVVDSYALDMVFESACRPWAATILAIDDLHDRKHDCDALLDQNLGTRGSDYGDLVPHHAQLLLGPDYALLRPQFAGAREHCLAARNGRTGIERILVTMGSFDPDNATALALRGLAMLNQSVKIDVVLGNGAPHLAEIRKLVTAMEQHSELHVSTPKMAALMAQADLAVAAAGSTSWERCCLGLPAVVLILADNQANIAESLDRAGAARSLGALIKVEPSAIANAVNELAQGPMLHRTMGERAAALCDGMGAMRVAEALSIVQTSRRPRVVMSYQ